MSTAGANDQFVDLEIKHSHIDELKSTPIILEDCSTCATLPEQQEYISRFSERPSIKNERGCLFYDFHSFIEA